MCHRTVTDITGRWLRPALTRVQPDAQAPHTAGHASGAVHHPVTGRPGPAGEQVPEGRGGFDPGQCGARAVVAAEPEGEMLRLPVEPEPVRLGEDTRITIGRAEQHEDDGFLLSYAPLRDVSAIRHRRIVALDYADLVESPRNASVIARLGAYLRTVTGEG